MEMAEQRTMEETRATRERLVQVSAVLHWSTPLKTLWTLTDV
jgi:hypothetical protein